MKIEKLVKMANEIAMFFDGDPDRAAALEGFIAHLKRFWDPRMRSQLIAGFDSGSTVGLTPLVAKALTERREQLEN